MSKADGVLDLNVAKVERFCDRKVPDHVRDQLRWEVETRGRSITIYERRVPWRGAPDEPWTKREMAQFRCDAVGMWTLYWANRNGRWLRVSDAPPTADIAELLRIVDENRTGAFD